MATSEIDLFQLDYEIKDVVNRLFMVSAKISAIKDEVRAESLNKKLSDPLMKLRREFGMASANVVKVKNK